MSFTGEVFEMALTDQTLAEPVVTSTALMTDHYELTALEAALRSGAGSQRAVFEVFARRLPEGRRYGVVAGTGRVLDAIEAFRFDTRELDWLRHQGWLSADTLEWLADYRFCGNVDGYAEGDLYFANSPVLTVEASFAEALILETVILSILNHDSAVASAAARMVDAADGRTLIEGGGRRTHEQAAVDAARAAYIAGFNVTSNLEAGRRYGIPTAGTTMHAFTLAHHNERAAFDAQVATFGPDTTFLVDTYDTATGIDNAVAACASVGATPGAIRIDSGDLVVETYAARGHLDAAGATGTKIVVSGDLDEFRISELADAPVDRYLAGTQVVIGSGAPTAGMVYKLVEVAGDDGTMRPVAKRSASKASAGGRKFAGRLLDDHNFAGAEYVDVEPLTRGGWLALQVPLIVNGERVNHDTAHDARARCAAARRRLRTDARRPEPGEQAIPTIQAARSTL